MVISDWWLGRGGRGRFGVEGFADALHDAEVIGEIVDGVESGGERFARLCQVT